MSLKKLPNHTVSINSLGFYAEDPTLENPVTRRTWTEIKIVNGPNRWYRGPYETRKIKFSATLQGDPLDIIDELEHLCDGLCDFASTYIGAFKAIVNYQISHENGFPNVSNAEFEVIEVE